MIEHKMLALFGGNMEAYGLDVPKGDDPAAGGRAVIAPLTSHLVKQHLEGKIGIGCYPSWHTVDNELVAKWGCCDIDTGDWDEAYALAVTLRAMGFVPHIERSRSKGWHIWIFLDKWVPAADVRRALKVAYAAIELPAKEANPKSEWLKPGQLGNYVRLPYKGALGSGYQLGRQCFVKDWTKEYAGDPVPASDFFYDFDGACQTSNLLVSEWAARWHEPVRTQFTRSDIDVTDGLVAGLSGELRLFITNGPSRDRSSAMVALGHKLRRAGYTADEIYELIAIADVAWGGKYASRPNREAFYTDIVERVI